MTVVREMTRYSRSVSRARAVSRAAALSPARQPSENCTSLLSRRCRPPTHPFADRTSEPPHPNYWQSTSAIAHRRRLHWTSTIAGCQRRIGSACEGRRRRSPVTTGASPIPASFIEYSSSTTASKRSDSFQCLWTIGLPNVSAALSLRRRLQQRLPLLRSTLTLLLLQCT